MDDEISRRIGSNDEDQTMRERNEIDDVDGMDEQPAHGFRAAGWGAPERGSDPPVSGNDSRPIPTQHPLARARETGPAARRQRYREAHRRIDYTPDRRALDAIERAAQANPWMGLSAIVDRLVAAAVEHLLHCTDSQHGAVVQDSIAQGGQTQ